MHQAQETLQVARQLTKCACNWRSVLETEPDASDREVAAYAADVNIPVSGRDVVRIDGRAESVVAEADVLKPVFAEEPDALGEIEANSGFRLRRKAPSGGVGAGV